MRTLVIASMRVCWIYSANGNADTDVSLVQIVGSRIAADARQHMVFISEGDPLPVSAERVHVRSASQRASSKWSHDITRVEVHGSLRIVGVNDHSAPMKCGILPVGVWVFWTMNENNTVVSGTGGRHSAIRLIAGLEQNLHFAGVNVNSLYPIAIEDISGFVTSHVVRNPLTIRRPNANVRQNMTMSCECDLLFHLGLG